MLGKVPTILTDREMTLFGSDTHLVVDKLTFVPVVCDWTCMCCLCKLLCHPGHSFCSHVYIFLNYKDLIENFYELQLLKVELNLKEKKKCINSNFLLICL